jgi:hypothetical protein
MSWFSNRMLAGRLRTGPTALLPARPDAKTLLEIAELADPGARLDGEDIVAGSVRIHPPVELTGEMLVKLGIEDEDRLWACRVAAEGPLPVDFFDKTLAEGVAYRLGGWSLTRGEPTDPAEDEHRGPLVYLPSAPTEEELLPLLRELLKPVKAVDPVASPEETASSEQTEATTETTETTEVAAVTDTPAVTDAADTTAPGTTATDATATATATDATATDATATDATATDATATDATATDATATDAADVMDRTDAADTPDVADAAGTMDTSGTTDLTKAGESTAETAQVTEAADSAKAAEAEDGAEPEDGAEAEDLAEVEDVEGTDEAGHEAAEGESFDGIVRVGPDAYAGADIMVAIEEGRRIPPAARIRWPYLTEIFVAVPTLVEGEDAPTGDEALLARGRVALALADHFQGIATDRGDFQIAEPEDLLPARFA